MVDRRVPGAARRIVVTLSQDAITQLQTLEVTDENQTERLRRVVSILDQFNGQRLRPNQIANPLPPDETAEALLRVAEASGIPIPEDVEPAEHETTAAPIDGEFVTRDELWEYIQLIGELLSKPDRGPLTPVIVAYLTLLLQLLIFILTATTGGAHL
jgi:hypothetical protein